MQNKFIRVEEVAKELEVSVPYAYKLIKKLNDELKEKGFITVSGRVNREYFYEQTIRMNIFIILKSGFCN